MLGATLNFRVMDRALAWLRPGCDIRQPRSTCARSVARTNFAKRFGFTTSSVREWEQEHRQLEIASCYWWS